MQIPIAEILVLLTSITVVPAILVVLYAFFTGRLTADEDRRFLPILEPEIDWWDPGSRTRADAIEGDGDRERA